MKNNASQSVGGSNLSGIAQYNERLVLQLIRRAGSLTKAEIARITNLSAQTASVIINRLLDEKLLRKEERRYETGKVGQPAVPIALNPTGAYSLGVKIGRSGLDVLLINFTGDILKRCGFSYPYPDPDFIFPTIRDSIAELTKNFTAA
ncbi:MarR family transcriptional regulator [Thiothrix subterranea]|nr:MarR family transcriptional regulator [Thiothrix subterranea]